MKSQNLQAALSSVDDADIIEQEGEAPTNLDHFDDVRLALASLDADFIVYAGGIQFGHEDDLFAILSAIEKPANEVILWLSTPGGNPDAAYSMARLLQRKYTTFTVFVNGWCKSSGTLMCLGASKLIMGDLAQLGPLDIQIVNKEEFGERHSGLNPIEALRGLNYQAIELLRQQFLDLRFGGGLSTRQALDVATNLTGQLMSPITSQLDIMKYGEFTRSLRIATDYGARLSKHVTTGNVRPEAIQLLTTGYPSHGFVIDREEASDKLFSKVSEPDWALNTIAARLKTLVDQQMAESNSRALLVDLRAALNAPRVSQFSPAQQEISTDEFALKANNSGKEEGLMPEERIDNGLEKDGNDDN